MKLLIIAYAFPPMETPRAYRWGAITRQLVQEGHEVDVVCACLPGMPGRRQFGKVRVHGVGGSLAVLRNRLAQNSKPTALKDAKARPSFRQRISGSLKKYLWTSLYWPDAQCPHIFPAWRESRSLLRRHRYDAMITVSLPFSCHWVGKCLKREFPDMPWIVDIGDPFAYLDEAPVNNHYLYRRVNILAERAILRAANRIAVTTAGAKQDYQDKFGIAAGKTVVIPPLFSSPASGQQFVPEQVNDDCLRWVYCGRLYRELRTPSALLGIFNHLVENPLDGRPIELHFYGGVSECLSDFMPYADLIGKRIFLHGQVSRDEAFAAQRQADVLINLGNTTTHQAPSKIVEYLGSGKPILNVAAHEQDTSREFLESHPGALTIVGRRDRLESNVLAVAEFMKRLPLLSTTSEARERIRPFEAPAVAAQYLNLVCDAAAPSNRYLQYRWRQTPVLTIPESPSRALQDGIKSLPANTWRRRLFRAVLQCGMRIGAPMHSHRVDSALDGDDGNSLANLLRELRSVLPDHSWFPIATYPSDPGRRRCYLRLLADDGTTLAYVKTARIDAPSVDERELNASHALDHLDLPFRRPKILHTGITGEYHYQVFEPLPPGAQPLKDKWAERPKQIATSLVASSPKYSPLEELSWWPDFVANQFRYPELFRQVSRYAHLPVETCQAHGDFHRANIAVSQDETWVFDWEDFSEEAPALTDAVRFYLGDRTRQMIRRAQAVTCKLINDFAMTNGAIDYNAFWQVTMAISFLCARNNGAGIACSPYWPSVFLEVDKDVANQHRLSNTIQAA